MPTLHRLGPWILGALPVLVALVSWRIFLVPLETAMPNMVHYLTSSPVALYAHIWFAPLALLMVPFQLWPGLRAGRPVLHRWTGRLYVASVVIAGLGSLGLVARIEASAWAATGFALLGAAWIGTTLLGIRAAWQGRIGAHRRWMIRSAALSFAAVTLRFMMPVLILRGMTNAEAYEIIAWTCWVPNLLVAEWWLSRDRQPATA